MTTITRDFLRALRADLDAAIKSVGEKHGVSLSMGNASFTDVTAKFSLNVAVVSEGQEGASPEEIKAAEDWKRYAAIEGLGDWVGKTFERRTSPGVKWTILGYMPRRTSYPILVKRGDSGKKLLLTIDEVKGAMAGKGRPSGTTIVSTDGTPFFKPRG